MNRRLDELNEGFWVAFDNFKSYKKKMNNFVYGSDHYIQYQLLMWQSYDLMDEYSRKYFIYKSIEKFGGGE
jgi:hypothetical protein